METSHTFRVEVWDDPPDAGGSIIEVISSSSSFAVSIAAYKAALRGRAGEYWRHMSGGSRMTCGLAHEPAESVGQSKGKERTERSADVLDDPEYTFASMPEWKSLVIHRKG